MVDRFGENVRLHKLENEFFQAEFKAAISPTFLSWMIGFDDSAIIVLPEWVSIIAVSYTHLTLPTNSRV